MPANELKNWILYLQARPIGWQEDQRVSMLLSAQGVKKPGHELFPSLALIRNWSESRGEEDVMRSSLKKSVFGALLETANK